MDSWHNFTKWLDYNRGVVIGLALAIVFAAIMVGCQITTPSPITPGTEVTAAELQVEATTAVANLDRQQAVLNAERAALAKKLEVAEADLQAKVEQRQALIDGIAGLGTMAAEGTTNPAAWIGAITQVGLLGGLLGIGYDNRRKDNIIKESKGAPTPAS